MDEKTAELRDIFIETTGSETATERQTESRGSLATPDDPAEALERLTATVTAMRERSGFRSGLDDETLVRVVRAFFEGTPDAAIASRLDVDPDTVFEARMDLHLLREGDRDVAVDLARLRSLVAEGADLDACLAALDADEGERDAVARARRVAEALVAKARVNDRYHDQFAELLTDDDLSARLAEDARNDGLREATEDIETDVSL